MIAIRGRALAFGCGCTAADVDRSASPCTDHQNERKNSTAGSEDDVVLLNVSDVGRLANATPMR